MRKTFSIIFFILFILIFPSSLLSFNLKQTILSPIFYKNTFREIDFYNRITRLDPQKIASYIKSKQTKESNTVDTDKIGNLITYIAPEDLQYTFEKNVDSFMQSSNSGQRAFAVDLTAIKKSISAKKPDSDTKELLNQIPDTYKPPQTTSWLNRYIPYIPVSKILSYFGFGFSILCLILSFILYPDWKGKLKMTGTILLIFGIFVIVGNLILRTISIPTNFVADFLNGLAHDLTLAAKNEFLRIYLIEGIVMATLGLASLVVSFFIKSQPKPVTQTGTPTK